MKEQPEAMPRFSPLKSCWVCGGSELVQVHQGRFDFELYYDQDPELASYSGHKFWLKRCQSCGFSQPDGLPTLAAFFDRMYDQRWSEEWIEQEFVSECKDFIFKTVLDNLGRRAPNADRSLLDIGAHVGRLIHLAHQRGWQSEGIELNPRTSAFAARKTNLPVHQMNAHKLVSLGKRYSAITLLDVLEHIPDPVPMLATIAELLEPRGWVAVKVPCGRNQLIKEQVRSVLFKGYKVSVADNLVHVNHFSARSLRLALEKAGFIDITITIGAPELGSIRRLFSDTLRLGVYHLGRLTPGGVHSPLALNLQAYARKA